MRIVKIGGLLAATMLAPVAAHAAADLQPAEEALSGFETIETFDIADAALDADEAFAVQSTARDERSDARRTYRPGQRISNERPARAQRPQRAERPARAQRPQRAERPQRAQRPAATPRPPRTQRAPVTARQQTPQNIRRPATARQQQAVEARQRAVRDARRSGRTYRPGQSNADAQRRAAQQQRYNRPNRDQRRYGDRYRDQRRYGDRYRDQRRYDNRYRDQRRAYNRQYRQWNRSWRRDNRYNWRHYRSRNRSIFSLGAYYSPYRSYRYRPVSIGFTLSSLFYGSRYWINDPWQYRLPPAYGPYRWVRYYDDALLVDVYSGEVIDVIYDFFW